MLNLRLKNSQKPARFFIRKAILGGARKLGLPLPTGGSGFMQQHGCTLVPTATGRRWKQLRPKEKKQRSKVKEKPHQYKVIVHDAARPDAKRYGWGHATEKQERVYDPKTGEYHEQPTGQKRIDSPAYLSVIPEGVKPKTPEWMEHRRHISFALFDGEPVHKDVAEFFGLSKQFDAHAGKTSTAYAKERKQEAKEEVKARGAKQKKEKLAVAPKLGLPKAVPLKPVVLPGPDVPDKEFSPDQLLVKYDKQIRDVAWRHGTRFGLDRLKEDFYQEAAIGFLYGAAQWDPQKHRDSETGKVVPLLTHAKMRAKDKVKRLMQEYMGVPQAKGPNLKAMNDAIRRFVGKHEREPNDLEIAKESGLAVEVIDELKKIAAGGSKVSPEEFDRAFRMYTAENPKPWADPQMREDIDTAMHKELTNAMRYAVEERFGFHDGLVATPDAIARELGVEIRDVNRFLEKAKKVLNENELIQNYHDEIMGTPGKREKFLAWKESQKIVRTPEEDAEFLRKYVAAIRAAKPGEQIDVPVEKQRARTAEEKERAKLRRRVKTVVPEEAKAAAKKQQLGLVLKSMVPDGAEKTSPRWALLAWIFDVGDIDDLATGKSEKKAKLVVKSQLPTRLGLPLSYFRSPAMLPQNPRGGERHNPTGRIGV